MLFRQLFDPPTSTYTYLLADEQTKEAVLIDPVREQVERDSELIEQLGLRLTWILDTHVHADHVTGAGMLRRSLGAKTGVSGRVKMACADRPLLDGDTVEFGRHHLVVRETPGHTDGDLTFVLDDQSMAFTGDTLLIRGCGRTDFQAGDAVALYHSVHDKIFSLPDTAALYPGHDYKGRTMTTVAEEKRWNPRLGQGKTEAEFLAIMAQLKLAKPSRIDEALPMNSQCGLTNVDVSASSGSAEVLPVARSGAGVPEVSPEWVASSLAHAPYRLVDVREPDEYKGPLGHIAGAQLVPLAELPSVAQDWDPLQPVVTVCKSGGRSGNGALQLERMGLVYVASMRGGMTAWNQQKRPVE